MLVAVKYMPEVMWRNTAIIKEDVQVILFDKKHGVSVAGEGLF